MFFVEKLNKNYPLFLSALKNLKTLLPVFLFIFFVSAASAQQVTQNQSVDDTEILRISTELIQTDVSVFDKDGRFVEGIRPEQFELRVDGKSQNISFFEFVKNQNAGKDEGNSANEESALQNGQKIKISRQPGRVVFFFLDDLHLQFDSINRTRRFISDFVEKDMRSEDIVAVLTASGQLGILQQPTSEKAVLRAALKRLVPQQNANTDYAQRTPMSEYQALQIENNDSAMISYFVRQLAKEKNLKISPRPVAQRLKRTVATAGGGGSGSETPLEAEVRQRARSIIEQSSVGTRNTLATLENLIRGSASNPARKVFFLFSDGFLLSQNSDARQRIQQVTDAAARAGVVIYPIEAQGLTTGVTNASQKIGFEIGGTVKALDSGAISATQEPLTTLADKTGGRALLNANEFSNFFQKVIDETSAYYMLGWQPGDDTKNNRDFRTITASIKGRDDLTVRVRQGFFNENPKETAKKSDKKAEKTKNTSPLIAALQSLYPRRSLPVFVYAGFSDTAQPESTLTASVQFDAEALGLGKTDKTSVNIIGVVLNEEGKEVRAIDQNLEIDFSKMTPAQQRSIVSTHQIPVKPGLYQIRFAAEEEKGKRIGSNFYWIEVPDVKQAGFSLGSILMGEVYADNSAQPLISVNRRLLPNSRLFFQTMIYNASTADVNLELQIFQNNQMVKSLTPRKAATGGISDLSRIPYMDDLSLAELTPGNYNLEITAIDKAKNTKTSRRIDFTVE